MKKLVIVILLLPFFLQHAYAEELSTQAAELVGSQALENTLREDEKSISGAFQPTSYDAGKALARLWRHLLESINNELHKNAAYMAGLISLLLLCGFGSALCEKGRFRELIEIACVCAAGVLLLDGVKGLIMQTTEAIYRLSDYSKAALPVVFTAAAASGAVSSAGVRYAAVTLALDVLMSISQRAVIPLIHAFLALTLTNLLFSNSLLAAAAKFAKWAATTAMTAAALAFSVYIGMTGLISGAVDATAIKTTKSILSGALPVVGSMVSDASAAVLSAAALVRNCSGVFGLIAVCSICAGPFAVLTVKWFLFKALSAAADSVQIAKMHGLFDGIGNTAALLMGLLGCNSMMLFLAFSTAMKAVSA